MLTYIYASLFDSPAQTLVNTVNTVGVMGKGVAKTFRDRYPKMFAEYRKLCDREELKVGRLHLWKGEDRWVLNFPTKTTWRKPSQIDYVEKGLETFVRNYERMGIVSASFPPLGCGNGNLNWGDVRPIIERYLSKTNIPIYVHSLHVGDEFVPEHKEAHQAPATLSQFWKDVTAALYENKGTFFNGESSDAYTIQLRDHDLEVVLDGSKHEHIPAEEIENLWVILRDGILSADKFSDDASRRYNSYLFPVLKSLPYIRSARVARSGEDGVTKAEALFFARKPGNSQSAQESEYRQECLSL